MPHTVSYGPMFVPPVIVGPSQCLPGLEKEMSDLILTWIPLAPSIRYSAARMPGLLHARSGVDLLQKGDTGNGKPLIGETLGVAAGWIDKCFGGVPLLPSA